MNRPWFLTRQAEESLMGIADWTVKTFGPRQAQAYEADLIDRCEAIARGEVAGQDCSLLVPGKAQALRFARAGGHFIIWTETPDRVLIVEFLHQRSDLPRRLQALLAMRGP